MTSDADPSFRRTVGANILQRRTDKEWTADELAQMVGVDRTTIVEIEAGYLDCEITLLARIAEMLETSAQRLATPGRARLTTRVATD